MRLTDRKLVLGAATAASGGVLLYACSTTGRQAPSTNLAAGDAAQRVYVAPGGTVCVDGRTLIVANDASTGHDDTFGGLCEA